MQQFWLLSFWGLAAAMASLSGAGDAPVAQGRPERGIKVSYSPLDPEQRRKEGEHSYRADFLSLAVERGETPTPMISPGMFTARFEGTLVLPVRDRYDFRIEGRGSCRMTIGGKEVLKGSLRPGRPLTTSKSVRLQKGDNQVELEIESTGAGEVQLRVYWSSADFGLEPIAPELWRYDAEDADVRRGEQLRHGHQLFVRHRCFLCHGTQEDFGAGAYSELQQMGPDLRDVGARLNGPWLREWLRDPRAVLPDSRMPKIRVEKDSDYDDMAAWLATLGTPLQGRPFGDQDAEAGRERFAELGCVACHVPPGDPAAAGQPHDRINLAFVGMKWRAAALETFLRDPTQGRAHSRMPAFELQEDDARLLAAFLLEGAQAPGDLPGDPERGRHLAQQHGCDSCHSMPLPESGERFKVLRGLHAEHGCLDDSKKAPDFGFDDEDKAALRAFLPHALHATQNRSPIDYAARMVPELRCTNCHGFAGEASIWAQVAEELSVNGPLPPEQDPIAQGIPALTWVGSKLQPSWMEKFVTGEMESPRPWLHAQMPAFHAHGAVVVQGLARVHGFPSRDEPEMAPDNQLASAGQKLVAMGTGFGCVQCHGVGDQPPIQVFERQGINFDVAAARLRKEYYMRWLMDPPRIDPDSRMPKYADDRGKTAFTDILDGDARRQFEAIWHYFRTL
jgi:cytochrome c2